MQEPETWGLRIHNWGRTCQAARKRGQLGSAAPVLQNGSHSQSESSQESSPHQQRVLLIKYSLNTRRSWLRGSLPLGVRRHDEVSDDEAGGDDVAGDANAAGKADGGVREHLVESDGEDDA